MDDNNNNNNEKLKTIPPIMIFEFVDNINLNITNTDINNITTTNIINNTPKTKRRMSEKMNRLANSLSWRQKYQNKDYYLMLLNDGRLLNVSQIGNGETKGLGTGTFVWPACHVLCKYLEKLNNKNNNNNYLNGKRFIDIGSGTGLTGFTAAALGGIVTLTDQKQLINFMNENKDKILIDNINTILSSSIIIKEYDWGKDCNHLNPPFDYILISDCVLPKLYPIEPLIDSIVAVMDIHSIALFSYEHRPFPLFDPRDEFIKLAQERGLKTKVIPISQHDHIYCADDIEIWEVTMISNNIDTKDTKDEQILKINNIEIDINSIVQILTWGEVEIVKANMKNGFIIDIKQQLDGSIGNYLWPSSVVLSRYLLSNDIIISNNNNNRPLAVELGAGCGLTTIALLMKGYDVISTDKLSVIDLLNENILNFKLNYETNFNFSNQILDNEINVVEFDWSINNLLNEEENKDKDININKDKDNYITLKNVLNHRYPDLIVCSDCLYAASTVTPLLDAINWLTGDNTVLLMANELRSALDQFTSQARNHNTKPRKFEEIILSETEMEICRGNKEARFSMRPMRLTKSFVSY